MPEQRTFKGLQRKTLIFTLLIALGAAGLAGSFWGFRSGQVILCLGDSLTASGYPDHLQTVLKGKGIRARVLNKGINGHTSGEYLHFLKRSDFLKDVTPDAVLLMLGTNDVRIDADRTPAKRFIENMEQIVVEIQAQAFADRPHFRFMIATIPPINGDALLPTFNKDSIRRVKEEINPAIKTIAKKYALTLVDNHGLFYGRMELIPDVHPTEEGYRIMAENWAEAITQKKGFSR